MAQYPLNIFGESGKQMHQLHDKVMLHILMDVLTFEIDQVT